MTPPPSARGRTPGSKVVHVLVGAQPACRQPMATIQDLTDGTDATCRNCMRLYPYAGSAIATPVRTPTNRVAERIRDAAAHGRGVCPRADVVRYVLRQAGLEQWVQDVRSGTRRTWVNLDGWDVPRPVREQAGQRLAVELRKLWDDGDERVQVLPVTGSVIIDRSYFWKHPAVTKED